MINLKKILLLVMLCLFFQGKVESYSEKKVLVLHSYHQGFEWTDSISSGIKRVFANNKNIEIYFEYLDAKRNFSENYFKRVTELYKEKSLLIKFDLIIVSDNAAFDFIMKNGDEIYPGIPIVFCGVNDFRMSMLGKKRNIAGIIERADHRANIKLIKRLHPDLNRIIMVNDQTLTGKKIKNELLEIIPEYSKKIKIEIWDSFFLEDLLDNLSKLDKRDVVYLLVLNRDKSGRFISSSWALGEITKTCPSPIYASWGFYLNRGIVGGNIIDGQLHGKYAAEIAKKILEDKNFKYQGLVKDNISNYIFDYKKLKKYGISLKLLPKGSIIINKSGGFFQKNYELLVRILIIMIAVVLFLIVRIMIKRKTEKELKQKVLQRTAELEKINKKLKKMAIIDDLTEIYNRRFILERLDFELKKCERYKKKLSLIMVDIDFFKSVNDKHGHLVGDKVLNRVARELQDNIREIDLVGRYGGEEFLIILTEAGRSFAKRIAERIRRKIEAIKFDEFSDSITISCGVAEVLVYNKDQVIKCVDSLLYQAKDKGRNRIVFN